MKVTTLMNHQKRAIGKFKDLLHIAVLTGMNSKELYPRIVEIKRELVRKKVPGHACEYVRGYTDALMELFMNEEVVSRYKVDGKYYSLGIGNDKKFPCWDTLPREEYPNLTTKCGLYYKDSNKPFSISWDNTEESEEVKWPERKEERLQ